MDVGVHCAGQGRGLSRGRSQVCWWFLFGPVLCSVKSEKKTAHICLGEWRGALSANSLCAPLSSRLKGLCSSAFQKVSLTCPFQEFHFRLPPTLTFWLFSEPCLCAVGSVRDRLPCGITSGVWLQGNEQGWCLCLIRALSRLLTRQVPPCILPSG